MDGLQNDQLKIFEVDQDNEQEAQQQRVTKRLRNSVI